MIKVRYVFCALYFFTHYHSADILARGSETIEITAKSANLLRDQYSNNFNLQGFCPNASSNREIPLARNFAFVWNP